MVVAFVVIRMFVLVCVCFACFGFCFGCCAISWVVFVFVVGCCVLFDFVGIMGMEFDLLLCCTCGEFYCVNLL